MPLGRRIQQVIFHLSTTMEKKLSTSTGYRHRKNPISTEIDRKYRSIALQMLKGEKEESFCTFPRWRDFIHGDYSIKPIYYTNIPVKIDEESKTHCVFVNILLENPMRTFLQLWNGLLESMLFAWEFSTVLGCLSTYKAYQQSIRLSHFRRFEIGWK